MTYLLILTMSLGVMATRFIPFILLKDKTIPQKYENIMNAIPYATISLLVVYAMKDVNISNFVPTLIASLICIITYIYKKNTIVSILLSTLIYMILIQNL